MVVPLHFGGHHTLPLWIGLCLLFAFAFWLAWWRDRRRSGEDDE